MSASSAKHIDQTITLDSSNETDIINCSIDEVYNKNKYLETPRSHLKRKCTSAAKNEIISSKGFQFKNENQQAKISSFRIANKSLRCKLWSSFDSNDSVVSDDSIIASPTPKRTKKEENKSNEVLNRLLPSLKNSIYLPYLCKTKLDRIGNWLSENDVETVTTPPFSSAKRSSVRPKKISSTLSVRTSTPKRDDSFDSSSVDSEVEKVLVAVYGKDWKVKNVLKRSKTEPKRNRRQILNNKTAFDNKAKTEMKSVKTAKRNILKTGVRRGLLNDEHSDNLESPCSLGVKKLNESGSEDITGKNFSSVRRRGSLSGCSSSSWKQSTVKEKNTDCIKKCTSRFRNTKESGAECHGNRDSGERTSRNITPIKSFLASLSVSTPKRRCDPEAQDYKINFKSKKEELTMKLFKLYNSEVFENGLPDDMNFTWNVKMRRTAGYCHNKKRIKSTGQVIRLSRIELSAKIVDRADRLRDTLIHELCHAASWVIDGMLDGHGTFWTKWSRKAMEKFPELPQIKRCHSYEIVSKYTYKCTGCGYSINRCSKSINTDRKRCGFCFGVLELYVNKKKKGKGEIPEFDSTRTVSAPNGFALFVKDNYRNVKSMKKDIKHGEIMKILSKQYALTKGTLKT